MTHPHPTDAAYAAAWSTAWSTTPEALVSFFAPEGVYTDVAMGATYEGRPEIARFQAFMLRFCSDSLISFSSVYAFDGHMHAPWRWSGTFNGPLRLRSGDLVQATGVHFSVEGIAECTYDAQGALTTHRDYWDLTTILTQAGVQIGQQLRP